MLGPMSGMFGGGALNYAKPVFAVAIQGAPAPFSSVAKVGDLVVTNARYGGDWLGNLFQWKILAAADLSTSMVGNGAYAIYRGVTSVNPVYLNENPSAGTTTFPGFKKSQRHSGLISVIQFGSVQGQAAPLLTAPVGWFNRIPQSLTNAFTVQDKLYATQPMYQDGAAFTVSSPRDARFSILECLA
jgi:hypothetical protein